MIQQKFITQIEESEYIDGEIKLLALCEIDYIMTFKTASYQKKADRLIEAFIWMSTDSGVLFWGEINNVITKEDES